MEVAETDGVHLAGVDVAVEGAERTGAKVEDQGEGAVRVRGLEQVAGRRGLRSGQGTAAADDGERDHQVNCSTPTTRPPISRDPMPSKAVGLPVVRKRWLAYRFPGG